MTSTIDLSFSERLAGYTFAGALLDLSSVANKRSNQQPKTIRTEGRDDNWLFFRELENGFAAFAAWSSLNELNCEVKDVKNISTIVPSVDIFAITNPYVQLREHLDEFFKSAYISFNLNDVGVDVVTFLAENDLLIQFGSIAQLARFSFSEVSTVETYLSGDPDSNQRWVVIQVGLNSNVDDAYEAYDALLDRILYAYPVEVSEKIRISLDLLE